MMRKDKTIKSPERPGPGRMTTRQTRTSSLQREPEKVVGRGRPAAKNLSPAVKPKDDARRTRRADNSRTKEKETPEPPKETRGMTTRRTRTTSEIKRGEPEKGDNEPKDEAPAPKKLKEDTKKTRKQETKIESKADKESNEVQGATTRRTRTSSLRKAAEVILEVPDKKTEEVATEIVPETLVDAGEESLGISIQKEVEDTKNTKEEEPKLDETRKDDEAVMAEEQPNQEKETSMNDVSMAKVETVVAPVRRVGRPRKSSVEKKKAVERKNEKEKHVEKDNELEKAAEENDKEKPAETETEQLKTVEQNNEQEKVVEKLNEKEKPATAEDGVEQPAKRTGRRGTNKSPAPPRQVRQKMKERKSQPIVVKMEINDDGKDLEGKPFEKAECTVEDKIGKPDINVKRSNMKFTGKKLIKGGVKKDEPSVKSAKPGTNKANKAAAAAKKEKAAAEAEAAEMKENIGIQEFYEMVKQKCVLSERWIVNSPREDMSTKQLAILIVEVDVTVEGDMRVKRCLKVLEDRSFRVLLDNVDMTHLFDANTKKIQTTIDVDKMLYSVFRKKVCQGLRNYEPLDSLWSKVNFSVKMRGRLWYAKDCSVVVQKPFTGNSCSACSKIRNQMKRRVMAEERKNKNAKPAIKHIKSSLGKALYSALNDFSGKGPIPPSQYSRQTMVFDEKLEVYMPSQVQERIEAAASMPPPPPPPPKPARGSRKSGAKSGGSKKGRGNRNAPATITSIDANQLNAQAFPIQEFITEDGQICFVTNVLSDQNQLDPLSFQAVTNQMGQFGVEPIQWGQMVIEKFEPPELEEVMTIGEHGNIIIQNIQGEEFTLAEGEEYELIGEAQPAVDPIEIIPADNQEIQIIEVDDETMEQMGVHGSMENMQIATVDPNDPNLSHILRAFQSQGIALM